MQPKTMSKLLSAVLMSTLITACGGAGTSPTPGGGGDISSSSSSSSSSMVSIRIGLGNGANFVPTKMKIDANSSALFKDQTTNITVNLVDSTGTAISTAVQVKFTSPCIENKTSSITGGNIITSVGGVAIAEYKAGTCFGDDTITASISSGSATGVIPNINNKRIGTGTGSSFTPGGILATPTNTSFYEGDTAVLSVNIADNQGNLVTQPAKVIFESNCLSNGGATILGGTNEITTINGTATASYKVGKCSVDDKVTAKIENGSGYISATTTIVFDGSHPGVRIGFGSGANFVPTKMKIDANSSALFKDQTTNITVNLVDSTGALVSTSVQVEFTSPCIKNKTSSITGGNIVSSIGGVATAEYKAGTCFGDDTITASISSGSATGVIPNINNKRIGTGTGSSFTAGVILTTPTNTTFYEGDTAVLSVNIADNQGNLVTQSAKVIFESECLSNGGATILGGTNEITTINGTATANYKVGKCFVDDKVTAKIENGSGYISANTTIALDSRHLGAGTGINFIEGGLDIGIGSSTLSPGGTTLITAYVLNAKGDPVTDIMNINFSSPCIATGNATITGTGANNTTIPTINGKVVATYTSTGCIGISGADEIKATTQFKTNTFTATGSIKVKADTAQTITFVDAKPSLINIKGTGGIETSIVRFLVTGQAGNPVKGVCVTFAPTTTVGGLSLVPSSCNPAGPETYGATSDANGYVTTTIQAGTTATPVSVIATTANGISTQSNALAVTTGIADQNSMTISVATYTPNSWKHDGVTDAISIRMADAFNNPVPNGTAVTFTTSGGSIQGTCSTNNGACSVNWTSQEPRPNLLQQGETISFSGNNGAVTLNCSSGISECRKGRVQISGTAIGNESFIDGNGNGLYDDIENDIFVTSNGIYKGSTKNLPIINSAACSPNAPRAYAASQNNLSASCDDLRESYLDKNFSKNRDFNEEFIDFDQNGSFSVIPNGKYDGALCSGTAKANGDCTTNKVTVRKDITLIMSSESPFLIGGVLPMLTNGSFIGTNQISVAAGNILGFSMLLADENGNGMPAGTSIAIGATNLKNATATISPSPIGDSVEPQVLTLTVAADPLLTPKGILEINITSGGLTTSTAIKVNPTP